MKKIIYIIICGILTALPACQGRHESGVRMKEIRPLNHQNRLTTEKSPYLLQHADNPVNWYPWGEEAFKEAREKSKPIFLSIGYSTCHWCHVMAHESFENEDIAAVINEYFIPVKVDREERPDIDSIYMTAVTSMTGQGGWPLSVFLTPDRKPFYGGTYFPPSAKWGSPGFIDILESIHKSWVTNKQQLIKSSQSLTDVLKEHAVKDDARGDFSEDVLTAGYQQFERMFDPQHGGFGRAPKFPTGHNLSFLLRYARRTADEKALTMVNKTLRAMAAGGMYDHLKGGFHRYSTDAQWHIPHFEKMLYDQALLAGTYLEGYQVTNDPFYARIAEDIFKYVLSDLTDASGGFYSAEDADSYVPEEFSGSTAEERKALFKKEGAFYIWSWKEVESLLGKKNAEIFSFYYGVEADGNAREDPHGEFTGKNILYVKNDIDETAKQFNLGINETIEIISRSKEKILNERNLRPRPHLDDKILVDWNGLMISALARGARILHKDEYAAAAVKAADFILEKLYTDNGRLLHRYRDHDAAIDGNLDDYAFFVNGLLELYQTTFDVKYLKRALTLMNTVVELFWDEQRGGFFFTSHNNPELLFRQKEIYDGAVPSGNAVAALDLLLIYHFTLDQKWEKLAEELFHSFAGEIYKRPSAYAQMLTAADYYFGPSQEIIVTVEDSGKEAEDLFKIINKVFLPNKILILRSKETAGHGLEKIAPFVESQTALKGKPTVYICENHVCKLPVTDGESVRKIINGLK